MAPGPASTWLLGRVFFRTVSTRLASLTNGSAAKARAETLGRASALYREHRGFSPDWAGRYHVAISCWVLAAYETAVSANVPPERAIGLVNDALVDSYARLFRGPLRVTLVLLRRPYPFIARILKSRALVRITFGRGFEMANRADARSSTLQVNRCLYHQFFFFFCVPELTGVICHSDHAWIDVLVE